MKMMEKGMNLRKKLLDSKSIVLGSFLGIPSSSIVEMLGYAGFDFLILDNEHGIFNIESVENCLRAAKSLNIPGIVRVPRLDPFYVQSALDMGAGGVQIPQIDTRSQALEAIEYCQFPPSGKRGFGSTTRAAGYGFYPLSHLKEMAKEDIVISLQIESREAVKNLSSILEIKRVDVIFIGTTDLSISYGYEKSNDPRLFSIIENLIKDIINAGKVPGIHVGDWSKIDYLYKLGFRYLTVSASALIWEAFKRRVNEFKESIK